MHTHWRWALTAYEGESSWGIARQYSYIDLLSSTPCSDDTQLVDRILMPAFSPGIFYFLFFIFLFFFGLGERREMRHAP